ncbi:hypothetical protein GCM10010467_28860 [Actinocorallia glomerata]|uniref:Uncharacterized protein n=2 Tax=Actinomycetes TaxID=1760 RepID=A0ABP6LWR1_9MICC
MPSSGWIVDEVLVAVLEATPSGASRASAAAVAHVLRSPPWVQILPRGRGLGVDALDMLNSLSEAVG